MRWEAQFFGNRWAEVFLATCCWAGTVRGIGPPTLSSLRPQSPYSGFHLKVSNIFFAVSYSFIYPCWTGTAYCSLLTWAETKGVRQLIIHGAVISSINMVMTGISRGISQLQISPHQKDPTKRDYSHPENSPAHSLRSSRIWIFFLRTVRLSLT